MGVTCECENKSLNIEELKNFFTRNNKKIYSEEEIQMINREKAKKRKLIKRFIVKNISRIYKKEKFNSLKARAQTLFFEKEELNFKYNKVFFEKKINLKCKEFFEQKENIIKDLFPYNLIGSLHSIQKLRDKISQYHNNNILTNQKEYLNDLVSYLTEHNLIKKKIKNPNLIKQLLAKMVLKDAINNEKEKNNFGNNVASLLKKNSKEYNEENKIKDININKDSDEDFGKSILKKESKVRFNCSWDQLNIENLIKQEIDDFFDVCFDTKKRNFIECEKNSAFLNIIVSQENKKNPQINFTWELKKLIKLLYYIFLLKKYNYLSDTNCFYKIKPKLIKRKSRIMPQKIVNKRESFSRNEKMLKIKCLKKVISTKSETGAPLESNILDSMSSILSEENDKEYNSNISTSNEVTLLKTMTKIEEEKNKIEEAKLNENDENNKDDIIVSNTCDLIDVSKKGSLLNDKREPNLKMKNFRINKKTKTGKKNKTVIFSEYYNGQFDESVYLYAGLGTLVSQNLKTLYHGTFYYGRKEGMGILYNIKDDKNMEYFMGEFRQNKINGFGIRIKLNETDFIFQEGIFEGEFFVRGKYKKIRKKDNRVLTYCYEGELESNKFVGNGKLIEKKYMFKQKDNFYALVLEISYKGQFSNGKKNGQGNEIFKSVLDDSKNYEYEGNFVNGEKNGYGIINYNENNFVKRYEGFFQKNEPFQIYGIANFKSGDIYEGFFDNKIKDFLGLYSFYDNNSQKVIEQYFGGYSEDFKNGIGKTIVEDKEQKMMVGTYKRGEKEGQFERILYKIEIVQEVKKRRGGVLKDDNYLPTERDYRKIEILPRIQTKLYPVFEENEIVDMNDNFFFDEFLKD